MRASFRQLAGLPRRINFVLSANTANSRAANPTRNRDYERSISPGTFATGKSRCPAECNAEVQIKERIFNPVSEKSTLAPAGIYLRENNRETRIGTNLKT